MSSVVLKVLRMVYYVVFRVTGSGRVMSKILDIDYELAIRDWHKTANLFNLCLLMKSKRGD